VECCEAVGGPGRQATFARNKLTALLFEEFKSCGVEAGALDKVAFDRSLIVNAPGQFRNFRGLTTKGGGGVEAFLVPACRVSGWPR
jgi:hypothetical protein